MSVAGLVELVRADAGIAEALIAAEAGTVTSLDVSAPRSVQPLLAKAVSDAVARRSDEQAPPVVLVTATGREADDLAEVLGGLLPPDRVAVFGAWETLPHERLSPRADTVGRRLAVLRRLVHPGPNDPRPTVLIAPVRSLLQPLVRGLADLQPVELTVGQVVGLDDVVRDLAGAAYTRVDLVERRGEFAVRGGLVDVFPPIEQHPLRVEFFGDEVESIRSFAVADQRTIGSRDADGPAAQRLYAPPCRELLLTDDVRARAAELGREHPELAEICERLAAGHAVEGMESLAPALVDGMDLFVELLPEGSLILVCDPDRVRSRAHDLVATSAEFLEAGWAAASTGGKAPIDVDAASFHSYADVRAAALAHGLAWWSTSPFTGDSETASVAPTRYGLRTEAGELVSIDLDTTIGAVASIATELREVSGYRGDLTRAVTDIRARVSAGGRVVLAAPGHGSAERLAEVLRGEELPVRVVTELPEPAEPGLVTVVQAGLTGGFTLGLDLLVLSEHDLFGQRGGGSRDAHRMPSRRRTTIEPLELRAGDYVVHEQHGVGRFVEMTERVVGSGTARTTREYLVLEYAASKRGQPADRLYVPTDQLDQVSRYVGGDSPTLDRIGGSDWARRKGRARKAVREIAAELIKLYAARQATPGYAFGPDTVWQTELEEAFPYIETPDQLAAVNEVKADMRRPIPMDRIICGDVGYGKTEIAVRAAFKAVQDGKQAAILVPTTLLVQQHGQTFGERMAPFPLKVASLSRFSSEAEAKEVLAGVADGTVDIVIGTHRLLGNDIRFKDLGLVIVDEEQRFGVEHKEKLKHLRAAVDVLTMSATPIPRTLEMAITGIREMSTITTPPEDRHPVLTFVGGEERRQISAAIRRELLREGQVFFVHNRVSTIEKTAAQLRELVPEARIGVGHGQMNEHQLEQVIIDFWEKRVDVLVCTTIVEAGIDVSNANTLIVERADRFGLSQLHQLRGRVGRSSERAYAYFLYPPDQPMTDTAHERLATIAQHTDLGSGMAVAMKDLEIRGAGNLLGGEQSGHIADVGFDLYVRLVGEAVAEFRGDVEPVRRDVKVELPIDAHLPHDYVESQRLRLEGYQRLAKVSDENELAAVAEELADRYGPLPEQVSNLLAVAAFRIVAATAGVTEVTLQGNLVRFAGVTLSESQLVRLDRLYPKSLVKAPLRTVLIPRPKPTTFGAQPIRDAALLAWATEVVQQLFTRQPVAQPVG